MRHAALEPLEVVAEATGALAITCDVADAEAVDRAVQTTIEAFGRLDIVVNNAGVASRGGVEQVDDDRWDQAIDINLVGPARVARAAAPHLRVRGGSIVNVASIGGLFATSNSITYATTKSALFGLTRSMAVDLGEHGIRVNTLCPGWVDTPMAAGAVSHVADVHGVSTDQARTMMVGNNPIRRMADPDEIAACIEFLVSDAASFVTGIVMLADGGQSIVDVGMLAMKPPPSA